MYMVLPLSRFKPSYTYRPFNCVFTALISLTNTILPKRVQLRCLERLVSNYKKDEFSVRVGQLVTTSPSWKDLMLEAYELPRPSVKEVLGEIALDGVSDDMEFSAYWYDGSDDKS